MTFSFAWVAIDNGLWNNDPAADPAAGVNGTPLSPADEHLLFPTVGGSSFGLLPQTCNFGASLFGFAVPVGFTPGWPARAGGWTTLNPATIGGPGSAGTLTNGNLTFNANTGGSWVQAVDGYDHTAGLKLYFEVHFDHTGSITDYFGAGVGRAYPGLDYSTFVIHHGGYDGSDPDGGVSCWSQHPLAPDYQTWLGALTSLIASGDVTGGLGAYQPGAVLRVAIQLGSPAPPPYNPVGVNIGRVAGFDHWLTGDGFQVFLSSYRYLVMSLWVESTDPTTGMFFNPGDGNPGVMNLTILGTNYPGSPGGLIDLEFGDAAGNPIGSYVFTGAPAADGAPHHVIVSVDSVGQVAQCYLDDVALPVRTVDWGTPSPMGTPGDVSLIFGFLQGGGGGVNFNYCAGDFFVLTPPAFYDLTVVGHRRKFINADGSAVDPGLDGRGPAGLRPIIWLTIRTALEDILLNRGTGGINYLSTGPAGPYRVTYCFGPNPPTPVGIVKVLLPPAELQFCDENGHPFAAGTLEMYVPGTTTPKDTWRDSEGTQLNTNPIVLDSSGRAIIYGDGAYRTVLRDAVGNLVWDQPSFTYISACMVPVVGAPDLATARQAMGITDAISAEAALRAAADAAETLRALAAEAALGTRIDDIVLTPGPPGPAGPAGSSGAHVLQGGSASTDSSGVAHITFTPPFANVDSVVACSTSTRWWASVTHYDNNGCTVITTSPLAGGSWQSGPIGFTWQALGE